MAPIGGVRAGYISGQQDAIPIPDSEANQKLIHRYYLSDVENGTVTDAVGSADGDNVDNKVSSVDGAYTDESAGYGRTGEVIEFTGLGGLGSLQDDPHAIAFTAENIGTASHGVFGVQEGEQALRLHFNLFGNGTVGYILRDNNGDNLDIYSETGVFDNNNKHRVVINLKDVGTSGSGEGFEFYNNQSKLTGNVDRNQGASNVSDYTDPIAMFATYRNNGSIQNDGDLIIDDFCIFNDSLTESEIKSYNNPF